jgi:hypothetical protein
MKRLHNIHSQTVRFLTPEVLKSGQHALLVCKTMCEDIVAVLKANRALLGINHTMEGKKEKRNDAAPNSGSRHAGRDNRKA